MFRLSQADIGSSNDNKDVDDYIPTYCIVRQKSAVCPAFDEDSSTVQNMSTPKDLLDNQQTDSYCHLMLKFEQGSDSHFTIDEDGLIFQRALTNDSLQVIVPEAPC